MDIDWNMRKKVQYKMVGTCGSMNSWRAGRRTSAKKSRDQLTQIQGKYDSYNTC